MPHDKVAWDHISDHQVLCEAIVEDSQENLRPLSDPVIMDLLKFCPQILSNHIAPEPNTYSTTELFLSSMKAIAGINHRQHSASFVPTGALQMFRQVKTTCSCYHHNHPPVSFFYRLLLRVSFLVGCCLCRSGSLFQMQGKVMIMGR